MQHLDDARRAVQLKDLCDVVQYGYTASASQEVVGPRFLRITDIVPPLIDWSTVPYCHIEAERAEKYLLRDGDIVIARTGATTGYAKYLKKPPNAVFASYLVRLRFVNTVDSRYVGYIVESDDYKRFIMANIGGAAQPNANAQVLISYRFTLPSLRAQRKIADILSAYDDLLENNTRRIQILEEMAQTIYREWFVNFRFPGHENVEMVESETGLIPKGWKVKPVIEAVEFSPTIRIDGEAEKPYVPMEALPIGTMVIDMDKVQLRSGSSGSKFQNQDTLLARITPSLENGKTGFVQFLPSDDSIATGSTEFIVMRSRTLVPEYVYFLARDDDFRGNAIKSMTGASGRQRVQMSCFHAYKIAHPSQDLLEKFVRQIRPMFELINSLAMKNANLRRTRNLLLPKLVSGEVRVGSVVML